HGENRVLVVDQQDGRDDRRLVAHAHATTAFGKAVRMLKRQRSQPGGTPARRASSSRSATAFLPSTTACLRRVSSESALCRSRSMTDRCAGSSRFPKSG